MASFVAGNLTIWWNLHPEGQVREHQVRPVGVMLDDRQARAAAIELDGPIHIVNVDTDFEFQRTHTVVVGVRVGDAVAVCVAVAGAVAVAVSVGVGVRVGAVGVGVGVTGIAVFPGGLVGVPLGTPG